MTDYYLYADSQISLSDAVGLSITPPTYYFYADSQISLSDAVTLNIRRTYNLTAMDSIGLTGNAGLTVKNIYNVSLSELLNLVSNAGLTIASPGRVNLTLSEALSLISNAVLTAKSTYNLSLSEALNLRSSANIRKGIYLYAYSNVTLSDVVDLTSYTPILKALSNISLYESTLLKIEKVTQPVTIQEKPSTLWLILLIILVITLMGIYKKEQ
jgi:hypothetical protein